MEQFDHRELLVTLSKSRRLSLTVPKNSILKSLISESKPADAKQTSFKFAVNSTIIQHSTDPRPTGTDPDTAQDKKIGRRGMHSAAGAYWNNEKDGMWSFKYEGAESKGMDIVIMIIWVAT